MDMRLSFPDLVAALGPAGFPGTQQIAFQVAGDGSLFVPPTLVLREEFQELEAPVVLVSARGAAGKSRAAEELSRRLGAPLWKLEQDRAVSGTSLPYLLGLYLGVADGLSALAQQPNPMILIDSLDEARAWVSGTSWADFLESIAAAQRQGCRFVLLGRERTLEEVWVHLGDAGVDVAWLEISHFGPQERCAYVDGVVSRRSGPATLEGGYYQAARDAVLTSVAGSVSGQDAETFAGYPPVLDAVAAVLLREDNHYALAQNFGSSNQTTDHLAELQRILDDLLKRDQKKMAKLATEIGLDPAAVYSPKEQLQWLCHDLEGGPAPDLSHIADPKVRHDYIEKIRSFVADHPFRNEAHWASTVFAAYTAAQLFGTVINGRRLIEIGNDSSLLFDLVALQAEPWIDDWGFAALHASLTAGEFSGALATVTAIETSDGYYEVTMNLQKAEAPYEKTFTLIPENAQVLHLHGPVEGLTVATTATLKIPAGQTPVVLGPDVFLHCNALTIEGPAVEFAHRVGPAADSGESDGMVTIEVVNPGLHLPHMITREPRKGTFELRVPQDSPSLNYPWVAYQAPLELPDKVNANDRAVRFMNMFMNLTRTHGHQGERGAFIKKLHGRQGLKGTDFQAAVQVLLERGIARLDGQMIYLRTEHEPYRFSGKAIDGQRLIHDVWGHWGPVVDEITQRIGRQR
ncbi:hypothetical protein [Actinomadura kijaniata]|uniref:hypothetical protein n=1 Tax=Actinomadura kijaniata TaxID=46161 RepID=UPI00082E283E|nr:hypothetical protein [Actinomadura kijaniata]